jgi:RNA polymerase sigma factor (sigma-70 family)
MAMDVSDVTLLERFVRHREEAAFVLLVKRHGPRVQGTCRRVLRNEHDVEEVFQATFLLLARKASAVAWRESVGSWLCAVAHRLALSARADLSRHRRREAPFATLTAAGHAGSLPETYHPLADPQFDVDDRELRQVLDDELLQLPEKYRAPVVLCDLEGRTHQEAAAQLGWPSGSISRRLVHARSLLRRRLVRRGVTLAIGLAGIGLAALWVGKVNHGPLALSQSTVRQAMRSLRPLAAGVPGVTALASPAPSAPDATQILILAHKANKAATDLDAYDPGAHRDEWRLFAAEMRHSAMQLAQAAQQNNQLAMLTAARRLDASCLKCHEAFHESAW